MKFPALVKNEDVTAEVTEDRPSDQWPSRLSVDVALGSDIRRALKIYTENEVAAMLGYDTKTLTVWRSNKKGPDFLKCGRNVLYRQKDLETWFESCLVLTDQPTPI